MIAFLVFLLSFLEIRASSTANTIMSIYRHIHHMELHHRAKGHVEYESVLLDLTRQRMTKHFGVDYNLNGQEHQQPGDPRQQPGDPWQQPGDPRQQPGGDPQPPSMHHRTLRHQQQPRQLAAQFQKSAAGSALSVPATLELSRQLASDTSQFNFEPAWDSHELKPGEDDGDSSCKETCECMASELLYGITKSLPYTRNAVAEDTEKNLGNTKVFKFECAPDTTPLWYMKNKEDKWMWNPSDPDDNFVNVGESDWQTCGSSEISGGGIWDSLQAVGMADVAAENKFLFQLLHDYNPSDNKGAGPPVGSNAKRYDAKEDLRICKCVCVWSVCGGDPTVPTLPGPICFYSFIAWTFIVPFLLLSLTSSTCITFQHIIINNRCHTIEPITENSV